MVWANYTAVIGPTATSPTGKAMRRAGQGEKTKKACNTRYSQPVTHASTNRAQRCLTSVIGREPVFPTWYGRRQPPTRPTYLSISQYQTCNTCTTNMMPYQCSLPLSNHSKSVVRPCCQPNDTTNMACLCHMFTQSSQYDMM